MKGMGALCFGLFLAGVLLFLAQMWFNIFTPDIFMKCLITDGAMLAVALVLNFIIREKHQAERMGQNRLD